MRKPDPGQLVLVYWNDCWSRDGWGDLETLRATYDHPAQTVGVYGGRNRSGSWIIICSIVEEYNQPDTQSVGGVWVIPSKMITRWRGLNAKGGGRRE